MGAQPDSASSAQTWQRSTRCDINGSCVEVARLASGQVGVRDGKIGQASPVLVFDTAAWQGLIAAVTDGHYNLG
jgi:hypothetical protein